MNRATRVWIRLRASFWFTPALVVAASLAVAALLVEVDTRTTADLSAWSPRLFGAGADGSRTMLSAIATSMVTVAGIVFSITIVALSLASTQYSPRVLRNFMRDGPTQGVLGVFLGVFAYCLLVLRTIRGGDEGAFIPSLAVLGGMVYALAGVAMLIYFIHHVAQIIQASSILARIAADTAAAIDHLFPQELGHAGEQPVWHARLPDRWTAIAARRDGYVTSVDGDGLLRLATECGRVVRMRAAVGDFVLEGAPLLEAGGDAAPDDALQDRLRACMELGSQRTVEQDAAFGLQQLVDVGTRSLSPGINDPATACTAIDQIGATLARLARRHIPALLRFRDGELRVIARAPGFGEMAQLALLPVVRYSRGDPQVLGRVLEALEAVGAVATPERRRELHPIARELARELAAARPRARGRELRRRLRALERE